ncbi:hypothetical protein U9M48_001793 [Paspalum notatum var. saurae]|uniref:Disease resistance protein RPM1 n=1 Tax=Paspalum notatum var. saurae TaxID=547442 RepID=A0AAQ3SFG7_PASNO
MADLVLGLATSAVEGTLTAAKSAIEEEDKLKKSMQRDLVLIKDEFEMMRSFLIVAKEHAASDEMVKTLVRQVRNMALDVEDCIESAVLIDVNKIRRWWWCFLIPSCMPAGAPVATLNDAVAAAQLLKSRVEAMGQRNERYMHIGDSGASKQAENKKTHQQAVADAAAAGILMEARNAKKRQGSPRDLVGLINKKKDVRPLQVISVWGAAGDLGVASIIKKTCDDPEICRKFSCRAWVKLPQLFNPHEFIRSLMAQFYTNNLPQQGSSGAVDLLKQMDEMMAMEATQLTEEFLKQVTDHTCLIFLEDVPTTVVWEAVKLCLPDKKNGSCIVVHTQELEVASLVVGQSQGVLELEQFSDDHSVCAFFNEKKTSSLTDLIELINKENDVNAPHCGGNLEICQKFKYRACVKLRHPFSHLEFIESLLDQILTNYCPQHGSAQDFLKLKGLKMVSEEARIKEFVKQVMESERYLVFLEDVSSTDDWDTVKKYLPDVNNGSCIVVHTHQREVASFCAGQSNRLLEWDLFLAEHSVRVFIKEGGDEDLAIKTNNAKEWLKKNRLIGRGADIDWLSGNYPEASGCPNSLWHSEPSPADNLYAKSVLHKCGGLPKVIVPVAKFIATNGQPNLDYFMQLLETDEAFGSLRDLFSWVHSYFQSCPDELKPCIFYLSIFPANHRIRRTRLVRRWIAEGYSTDTRESSAEEKGSKFFEELCRRNMVQVPGSTSVSYMTKSSACQFNGFFREYIMSQSMEENLAFALEGHCSANSQRSGRHLTIGSTWDRDMSVYRSIDLSQLRSLTVSGKWESSFISDDKMRLVRVLDLEDATSVTDDDLKLIVKLLHHLKFLSLRRCKEITHLPDSFGSLRQLQTLDIRHTSIVKLPRSFTKLQKLQHISGGTTATMDDYSSIVESPPPPLPEATAAAASSSSSMTTPSRLLPSPSRLWPLRGQRLPTGSPNGGIELPRGIGKMMALQNISVIDISIASRRRPAAVLEELKGLTQLRKFGVSGVNSENCKELCSAISGHPHLEYLSVWLDKNQGGCLDAISPPPEKLESLKIHGDVGKLPAWISQLINLTKLKLRLTMITQDDVDLLKDLPSLSTLCLGFSEVQHGHLRFRGDGMWCFRRLLILEIVCNNKLKYVVFESLVMPWLEVLNIHCSNVSSLKFSGLQELRDLREVQLRGTYDDKVWEKLKSNLEEHRREIVLKPDRPSGC